MHSTLESIFNGHDDLLAPLEISLEGDSVAFDDY
jgi:hypothetical protein